ncbi:MAG: CBS and ACT domain-containing protein [Chloroflexota bacterium]
MLVKDAMTTNVVTVPSTTPVMEAMKIMDAHDFQRLPVVDKGKLVGIVTKNAILRASPSAATSLSIWEINHLISKMTVKDIMVREVVTVPPETAVESAVATAQRHRVGALPVMEGDEIVGIMTTNDFFYRILNPLLGIGEPGTRIIVYAADTPPQIAEVMETLKEQKLEVKALHSVSVPDAMGRDLIVHLATEDTSKVEDELKQHGFHVERRTHSPIQG